MFDLEQSIADWRRRMTATGVNNSDVLDELEGHLRADFHALAAGAKSEEEAFQRAFARVGTPGALRAEFNKLEGATILPVNIGTALWITATLLMAACFAEVPSLLMNLHLFTLTIGYSTMFLLGAFGIFYVCYRSAGSLSPRRRQSLNRAVFWFSHIAAALAIIGVALAVPVSQRLYGRYWSWDPREIGGLCVIGWLIITAVMLHLRRDRLAMLMCVGCNVVVALAWFHAALVARYPLQNTWPWSLDLFIGINLFFLIMGLAPVMENGPKNV